MQIDLVPPTPLSLLKPPEANQTVVEGPPHSPRHKRSYGRRQTGLLCGYLQTVNSIERKGGERAHSNFAVKDFLLLGEFELIWVCLLNVAEAERASDDYRDLGS